MQQEPEQAKPLTPPMEQQPTIKEVSITPPPFVDDPKQIKRPQWVIDGKVPIPFLDKWIKTKNLTRDVCKRYHIPKEELDKVLFLDNYEEAASMYVAYKTEQQGT